MLIKISILLISTLLIFSCKKENNNCSCIALPIAADNYNYPIKPGTPEWNKIRSTDSLFIVSQIPLTTLKSISTSGLVESCIDNPVRLLQFIYTNRLQGRDLLFTRLNSFQELIKRQDGALKIIERYEKMDPCCIESMTDNEKGDYSLLFYYTEILLTKDSIINQLNTNKKKDLAKDIIRKDTRKKTYLDNTGISVINRTTAIIILSTIMLNESYLPFINELNKNNNLKTFTQTGLINSLDTYDIVLNNAKQFIK